jgi:phosphoenolpyruvate carboxylase
MTKAYLEAVVTKYNIFNSLFLNLPFFGISRTGTLLPLLTQYSVEGFEKGQNPKQIIQEFSEEMLEKASERERADMLFNFIQYIERQVVLFDSIEDAAFGETHDMNGKGSIAHLLARVDTDSLRQKLLEKLDDFCVRLVLTAHPTQFYPDKVLWIIEDLENAIRKNDFGEINRLLMQLGKTGFINRKQPTPYDEAVSLCWYLEHVFYNVFPKTISKLLSGLKLDIFSYNKPQLLRLGFWPGGDRDGNPFVNADITGKVALLLQQTLLRCYHKDVLLLKRRFTFDGVEEHIARMERCLYNSLYDHTQTEKYSSAQSLLEDLIKARNVLILQHNSLFLEMLDDMVIKVRLFGFFFASLDIRQDSSKHTMAWTEILKKVERELPIFKYEQYETWEEAEKINFLLSLNISLTDFTAADPIVNDIIASIRAISDIQKTNGEAGAHRYVISHCESALNVVEVLALARLLSPTNVVTMDIVPLFETIDDLANASKIMQALYANEVYKKHLQQRANKQTIMVGFSDGTKDGGYLRSNWSIFRAKEEITKMSRENGIKVVFFDGRGGPPGRGGGNNQAFYASLGKGIEDHEIQVTIQGQTISSNYGAITTASYNLERLFTAGLENHLFTGNGQMISASEKNMLEVLAETSYQAYLKLKLHPCFVPYLEKMTPLTFYGASNIGSRPAKRNAGDGLQFEDLRAIPFVGSWAQMKQNIPGFYGFGAALAAYKAKGKLGELKKLYAGSLFFRTLVENSMQSLSKAYYPATKYIESDPEFGEFWKMMHEEYERTCAMLLEISGQKELLEQNPVSKESIQVREKIVLPLITIQQYALQMLHNSSGVNNDILRKLVLRAMFGIINAARNSA